MPYNRAQAVQYAARWWNGYNPRFRAFYDDDCSGFISQCLLAGGMPMEITGRRDKGWWYLGPNEQWSYSWAVAHSMRWYFATSRRAQQRPGARDLEPGDVIHYDWDGDGVWQHSAMVVGFAPDGEPLVAAHTAPAWGRPWRYSDARRYSPQTKYLFWHINLP